MPVSASSVASLAQGLTKVSRPISAPPFVNANQFAAQTVQRSVDLSKLPVEAGLARVPRPYPFTSTSLQVGLERAQRARVLAQSEAVLIQSEQRASQALANQIAGGVRNRAVVNVLERVPVVGRVLTRVAPVLGRFAGPLAVVSAISLIPTVFEYFAPDVNAWLLGGWRQSGHKANQLPPGVGQSAVLYRVSWITQELREDGSWRGDRVEIHYNVMGPIGSVVAPFQDRAGGTEEVRDPSGRAITYGNGRTGFSNFRLINVTVTRMDGVPETGAPFGSAPQSGTGSPTTQKPAPVTSPAWINNPQNAQNAALAAVLGTILAGKLKLNPPSARDALKTPQKRFGTASAPSPIETAPATNPCQGNACGGANLEATKGNAKTLDELLQYLQALGIGDIKKTVDRIDTKMGAQIVDERGVKIGVGGMLKNVFEKVNKVGNYLHFDRITNVLTLAATIHNATMLSNQLEQTLAQALSSALAVIGIKDFEGNQLDINKVVGKSIESVIKGAIGAQNYTELTTNWKKANRIYQAGANLIGSVQSLRYSIMGALDTIGSMNAKMANALKKFGVVGDSGYGWFNPTPNFDNRFMRGLETAENVVSNIDNIASEVLSAQETVTQIGTQKTELETAVKDGLEKRTVENVQQKDKATAAKTASKSPDIVSDNLIKPES
jgi:hypothetical protein